MKVDEILEKAKTTIEVRENEIKQLEHKRQAYTIKQVKKKFPRAIFENGELSEQTPKDIYCDVVRLIGDRHLYGCKDHISLDPVVKEITDKIKKIRLEITYAESSLDDASKFTDASDELKNKLFFKENLLNNLKGLKSQIDHIDSRIETARTKYSLCSKKIEDLKKFIG